MELIQNMLMNLLKYLFMIQGCQFINKSDNYRYKIVQIPISKGLSVWSVNCTPVQPFRVRGTILHFNTNKKSQDLLHNLDCCHILGISRVKSVAQLEVIPAHLVSCATGVHIAPASGLVFRSVQKQPSAIGAFFNPYQFL